MPQSLDLIEFSRIFWKRKTQILFCAVIVATLALLVSFIIPKQYSADTSIIITESPQTKSLSGFAAKAFGAAGLAAPSDTTVSYDDILKSRTIILKVIDSNDLREYFEYPADKSDDLKLIREIRENLSISSVRDNVLRLNFTDSDPEIAAKIANSFITHLSEFLQSGNISRASHTRDFIESQIIESENELHESEEELKKFSADEEAAGIDEQIIQVVRNAAEIEAMKTSDEVKLSLVRDKIAKEKQLQKSLGVKTQEIQEKYKQYEEEWKKPGNLLSSPQINATDLSDLPGELLLDSSITQLRSHLTELKIELLGEKITKTEKHPSVIRLNDEIFKIRDLFINEISGVIDTRAASLEFERIDLEAQIAAYDHVLVQFEDQWKTLPEKSMKYLRLRRDVEALSQVYLLLKQQLAEAKIDSVREDGFFEILDPALPPDKPVSPKPVKNTLTGFLLGLVFGIGLVYLNTLQTIRKKEGVR